MDIQVAIPPPTPGRFSRKLVALEGRTTKLEVAIPPPGEGGPWRWRARRRSAAPDRPAFLRTSFPVAWSFSFSEPRGAPHESGAFIGASSTFRFPRRPCWFPIQKSRAGGVAAEEALEWPAARHYNAPLV